MGTNYYLIRETNKCEHCGRADVERRHIGKSSVGWCFSLHVERSDGPQTFDDWKRLFTAPDSMIEDEYHQSVSVTKMIGIITRRDRSDAPVTNFDFAGNHAQPGPKGLVRHRIDGDHCIGHGEGTWDLISGEFS